MTAAATQTPPHSPMVPTSMPDPVLAPVPRRHLWHVLRPWIIAFTAAWTVGFLHNRYIDQDEAWTIGLYRAKSAQLTALPGSHRVILVGGSGTHFGFDAALLGETLGRPTYNAGLDAGLGIAPICESVAHDVRPGDVLVLTPEFELLSGDGATAYLAPTFGWATLRPGIGGGSVMERVQLALLGGVPGLRSLMQSAKSLLSKRYSNDGYAVSSLDALGDPTIDPPSRARPTSLAVSLHPHIARYLTAFVSRMRASQVRVIIALPWRLVSDREASIQDVRALRTQLEAIAPVIANAETLNLSSDRESFTDTKYHLTKAARIRRSIEMAVLLRPLLTTLDPTATEVSP